MKGILIVNVYDDFCGFSVYSNGNVYEYEGIGREIMDNINIAGEWFYEPEKFLLQKYGDSYETILYCNNGDTKVLKDESHTNSALQLIKEHIQSYERDIAGCKTGEYKPLRFTPSELIKVGEAIVLELQILYNQLEATNDDSAS